MKEVQSNANIIITDKDGNTLENNTKLATGMIAKVGTKTQYVLAIKGDVNRDGEIDFEDILKINKHRLEKQKLEGVDLIAGDINKDGKTDFEDILMINKYRLGKLETL